MKNPHASILDIIRAFGASPPPRGIDSVICRAASKLIRGPVTLSRLGEKVVIVTVEDYRRYIAG